MWVNFHGSVYVPVTRETQPNPYLKIPERDVANRAGKPITLMNPAYVMHYEKSDKKGDVKGHITSLKPLRPENKPDLWEEQSLRDFAAGQKEATVIETIQDTEYARFMKPFIVEKDCLKCHAQQGYKEGDIRGGISVSVPTASLKSLEKDRIRIIAGLHAIFWGLGLAGIILFGSRTLKSEHQRMQMDEEVNCLAYHDTLTGLPKKMLFMDRLTVAMNQADRRREKVAVLMLDLDKFKEINDTFGQHTGDLLLQAVAERLVKTLRKVDTVARFGGDEFNIVLTELKDSHDGAMIARKIIDSFLLPFSLERLELLITISIGIVLFPDHGKDINTILKNADHAMHSAKAQGQNQYYLYK
jgi:diguanylate cyclase (GGDEF) domain